MPGPAPARGRALGQLSFEHPTPSSGAGRALPAARSPRRCEASSVSSQDLTFVPRCCGPPRRAPASARGYRGWKRTLFIYSGGSGTIPPGWTLHKLDRRHAYVERMPTACRRVPEARERGDTNLRAAGVARTCGRVPTSCRRVGTPQPSFHGCEAAPRTQQLRAATAPSRLLKAFLPSSLRRRTLSTRKALLPTSCTVQCGPREL
jgi:hypothetical protein